jgi:hypothetical protein
MFPAIQRVVQPDRDTQLQDKSFMKYRAKSLAVLFLSFVFAATLEAQQANPASATVSNTQTATVSNLPATVARVALETSLTSKSAHEGTEVKAIFRRPITLPSGEPLPKGTVLLGRVVQVSSHSKARPNRVMLLLFNEAQRKDGVSIPLSTKIQSLSDVDSTDDDSTASSAVKPNETAASGNAQQQSSPIKLNPSGLDGVFLQSTPAGSGIVFSAGTDVYLDSGTHITLLLARSPASARDNQPASK